MKKMVGVVLFACGLSTFGQVGIKKVGSDTPAILYVEPVANAWRDVGGQSSQVSEAKGWELVFGRVSQVLGGGKYLISVESVTTAVKNARPGLVDHDWLSCWAKYVGNVSYGFSTIRAYDCGTPWQPSVEAIQELGRRRIEAIEKDEAMKPILASNALRFQFQQASNGMPSAQCSLGKRYLAGDGVPKDPALAKYWLEKSAAQDNVEAKAALSQIRDK